MMNIEILLEDFKIEIVEAKVTPKNLKKWNLEQIKRFREFLEDNKKSLVSTKLDDNMSLLMKYAEWFRAYKNDKGHIPSYESNPTLKWLKKYKTKRKNNS